MVDFKHASEVKKYVNSFYIDKDTDIQILVNMICQETDFNKGYVIAAINSELRHLGLTEYQE